MVGTERAECRGRRGIERDCADLQSNRPPWTSAVTRVNCDLPYFFTVSYSGFHSDVSLSW